MRRNDIISREIQRVTKLRTRASFENTLEDIGAAISRSHPFTELHELHYDQLKKIEDRLRKEADRLGIDL